MTVREFPDGGEAVTAKCEIVDVDGTVITAGERGVVTSIDTALRLVFVRFDGHRSTPCGPDEIGGVA